MEAVLNQLPSLLTALWWPFCRVLAMFSAAPILGENMVPISVRILLSLALLQLVGMATALVGQIVAESAYTHTRKILLGMVLIMAVVGLAQAVARAPVHGAAGLAASFRSTWPGQVLLAPFELFSRAIFAERWFPDLSSISF